MSLTDERPAHVPPYNATAQAALAGVTDATQILPPPAPEGVMTINLGPQHPSTHGVLRVVLDLDGETVVDARPDIGYLHTGIEKTIENKRYESAITCTDRMDYLNPLGNNLGFCLAVEKYERLLTKTPIWRKRTIGVGPISGEEALEYGMTGPPLRASGVNWDLRKEVPYSLYQDVDFAVPVLTEGDCYARYLVRVMEMRESIKIVNQMLDNMPDGPVLVDDRKIVLPPKEELASSMEAVIHHFKLVTEGLHPPVGEVYQAVESPRGELGFYVVSDGSNKPHRCAVR